MRHQKGFTLIELIVVLGLAGIIMSLVFTFFIMNIKSYETINTQSERQYQSQKAINFMTNKILEAKKFVGLEDDIYKFSHNTKNFGFKQNGQIIKLYEDIDDVDYINKSADVVSYVDTFMIEAGPNPSEIKTSLKLLKDKEAK